MRQEDQKLGFETRSLPHSLAPTLVTLPSMSRVPRAPFTKTESPAYAPASASILFPGFRFAAERRDSLDRFAKSSRPPAVKFAPANRSSAETIWLLSVLVLPENGDKRVTFR